jgi:hypothetical protein
MDHESRSPVPLVDRHISTIYYGAISRSLRGNCHDPELHPAKVNRESLVRGVKLNPDALAVRLRPARAASRPPASQVRPLQGRYGWGGLGAIFPVRTASEQAEGTTGKNQKTLSVRFKTS